MNETRKEIFQRLGNTKVIWMTLVLETIWKGLPLI